MEMRIHGKYLGTSAIFSTKFNESEFFQLKKFGMNSPTLM